MLYKFKSCGKCGGDLRLDEDEWCCFQCGTVYYPQNPVEDISPDAAPVLETVDFGSFREIASRQILTDDNSVSTNERSDRLWWTKSQTGNNVALVR